MSSIEPFLLDLANRVFLAGERSRNRAVRRSRLGLLFVVCLLALCLFITGWAGLEWFRWLMLQDDLSIVSAQVVRCRKDSKTDGEPLYYVTYRFEAPSRTGLQTVQREQSVSKGTYTRLSPGQVVSVRYNHTYPSVSGIANDTSFRDGISVGAILWLPVTFFMGWQVRQRRRALRLGRQGQLLEGRVVSCDRRLDAEGSLVVDLHYRFTAPGGKVIRGKATACRDDLKESPLPHPDKPVAVLYLDEQNYKLL